MNTHHPSRVIAGAALLALVISFVAPFPVLAEESSPPAEPSTEATPPPEAAALESEATPMPVYELPVAEGEPAEPVLPEATSGEASPGDAAAQAEPELGEVIELTPEGTTIAVVDEAGELLPLVSEEAAEVIAGGDPVWCPASLAAPTPGLNGCTASGVTSFAALIADLTTTPQLMDGIIWFEDSYSSGVNDPATPVFTLNGFTTFSTMAPYKLTLRGGWDGVSGSKAIDPTNPSEFNARLEILNWQNDVTLSDLLITGATGGAGSTALQVTTTGNINLTRVDSIGNQGTGVRLDNSSPPTPKTISVSSSQFNNNGGSYGLLAVSAGKITLAGVIASDNTGSWGAYLDNTYASSAQAVLLTGLNAFNGNADIGLEVDSEGAITAADLTATDNGGWGAKLWNYTAPTAQAVTLTGTNIFTDNDAGGLDVSAAGAIKLNSVIANANGGMGAQVINTSATTAQPVTLTGTSTFKYNDGMGLYIASNGAVTLNNITASGSATNDGLEISNTSSITNAAVKLTGYNTFNDNAYSGLRVYSNGLIQLANLTALGNGQVAGHGFGVLLYNAYAGKTAGVTLTGTNNLSGNYANGLYLASNGPVTISNLTASNTTNGTGAEVNNSIGASPQKLTLTGRSTFTGNAYLGVSLSSLGAIAASNLTATGNGWAPGGSTGVYFDNSSALTPQPVTISGANQMQDNGRHGLEIRSKGAISVSSLTSTGNGFVASYGSGAALYNNSAAAAGAGITLNGTNVLSDNYSNGLVASSQGPITVANLTASGNAHGYGADLENGTLPPQKLSLTGTNVLNENFFDGLYVASSGPITIATLTANGNGGYGASLSNTSGGSAQPVTLSGSYQFNDNAQTGLSVGTYGLIKVNNLTASGNGSQGASLTNSYPTYTAGITLSGKSTIADNTYTGLYLSSFGPITIANLSASGNGVTGASGYGADISNGSAVTAQKVTFTGTNVFTGNQSAGLNLFASGAISVSNLSASGTLAGSGAYLSNNVGSFAGTVTLTGAGAFNDNAGHGLQVLSYGAISLKTTRVEASRNATGNGLRLINNAATSPQKVTLGGTAVTNDNYSDGLYIDSLGAIAVSNLTASGNTNGRGARLSNSFTNAVGGVTLAGSSVFQDNAYQGVEITSYGPVSLNNLTATGNGYTAAYGAGVDVVNVTSPATPQSVKLTGASNLSGNYAGGLGVASNGAITISNLTANDTDGYGAYLYNAYSGSVGGITFTGTNVFNGNRLTGLEAVSLGAIVVNNLTANDNGIAGLDGYGARLRNSGALTPQKITLTGSNTFNGNYYDGLAVTSIGAIAASNLTARGSSLGTGAIFDNLAGGETVGVTLSGTNTFADNSTIGLSITSAGPISATRVYADGNGSTGMRVYNNVAGVTVTCGSFVSNPIFAVYVSTAGELKLVGVVASGDIGLTGGGTLAIVRACPLG